MVISFFFLLEQQLEFTKYSCFICMLYSIYMKGWILREELVLCRAKNLINNLLVNRDRILFQPLHIKLGLINQFTKTLDKDGGCFSYLCYAFPGLTLKKLKVGPLEVPQICQLIRGYDFENLKNKVELKAWRGFVLVVKNFHGNNKAKNYTIC